MKRLITLCALVLACGCTEEVLYDKETQLDQDGESIREFLAQEEIDAMFHATGFYYQVIEEGEGTRAELNDIAVFHLSVYGLDGTFYFSTIADVERQNGIAIPIEFRMEFYLYDSQYNREMEALYDMALVVEEGAIWELYVPSYLAYGYRGLRTRFSNQRGIREISVPSNTPLRIEARLIEVKVR